MTGLKFRASECKTCAECGSTFYRDKRNTWKQWSKAKYCSRQCTGRANSKAFEQRRPAFADAFWSFVFKSDGCWEWTSFKDKDGYGLFSYAGVQYRANRIALELDGRPADRKDYACHHCDNPGCVRPSHLYPGTPLQNSQDAHARKRAVRGERTHMAKLTEAAVRDIRQSDKAPKELAQKYGVTDGAIHHVLAGKTWRHVE